MSIGRWCLNNLAEEQGVHAVLSRKFSWKNKNKQVTYLWVA